MHDEPENYAWRSLRSSNSSCIRHVFPSPNCWLDGSPKHDRRLTSRSGCEARCLHHPSSVIRHPPPSPISHASITSITHYPISSITRHPNSVVVIRHPPPLIQIMAIIHHPSPITQSHPSSDHTHHPSPTIQSSRVPYCAHDSSIKNPIASIATTSCNRARHIHHPSPIELYVFSVVQIHIHY